MEGARSGREGSPSITWPLGEGPPGDLLPILQSDWLSRGARRPPVPLSLPCAPAHLSWGLMSEKDSWDLFLLQNINDFPFLSGLGIDISWHCPRKLPGCQPACPPTWSPQHHLGGRGNTPWCLAFWCCLLGSP